MTRAIKENLTYGSAIGMLLFGVALTTAGFIIDPAGQIHDSVLYVLGQCLIFAGSVMGVSAYATGKMRDIEDKVRRDIDRRFRSYDRPRNLHDPMQMDDYGMHHCREDASDNACNDEKQAEMLAPENEEEDGEVK